MSRLLRSRAGMPASGATRRPRPGFTLPEMTVAMVLLSLVAGAALSTMLSQARYVARLTADVQQVDQVRTAADLLGTEIADLVRGSVLAATPDSISYRLPVAWGVVCGLLDRAQRAGSISTAAVHFEPITMAFGTGSPDGIAVSRDGVTWSFSNVPDWGSLRITPSTNAKQSCLGGVGAAATNDDFYEFSELTKHLGAAPAERTLTFAYVTVSYFFREEAAGGGKVLYRAVRSGQQKLAWPFASGAGFRYRLVGGAERIVVDAAQRADIRAVRVSLPALRAADGGSPAKQLAAAPWLPLYNGR